MSRRPDPVKGSAGRREPSHGATVGVKTLRAALAIVAKAGLDANAIAARHGLRVEEFDDPEFRFPHDTCTALWDDVALSTGDAGIGIHASASLPMGQWDVVEYMIASSATVGEGLRKMVRYFPLISTAAEHLIEVGAETVRVVRQYGPHMRRSRPGTELAVSSIVLRFRDYASVPWVPESVTFEHEPAVPVAEYERVFGCPVLFSQPNDTITIRRDVFDISMRRPEAELSRVLERHARLILEQLPPPVASAVAHVRSVVTHELCAGVPNIAQTAKRMGTSARTLQRRLDAEGVTYRDVVQQTRERLARRYLEDPTLALAEVAFLLGFRDVSAFYKAFHRWEGKTPGAYRSAFAKR